MTLNHKPPSVWFISWLLILVILLTSCAESEYWIPPSSAGNSTKVLAKGADTEQTSTTQATDSQSETDSHTPVPDNTSQSDVPTIVNTPDAPASDTPILYKTQAADTLPAVAVRFGVDPSEITAMEPIPETEFLKPGILLVIPNRLGNTTPSKHLLPDSEVVYSPSAIGFDIQAFVALAGGKLSQYTEWRKSTGFTSGAGIVQRVAIENSINPRLLLSLLEYQSGWVYGQPQTQEAEDYPLGYINNQEKGLYNQLVWAVNQISTGYYAWREGRLTEISLQDGSSIHLAPDLNAGTAALQYYFALHPQISDWMSAIDPDYGFAALHANMFGDPMERAKIVEPLYPPDIWQPALTLPFVRNTTWSFTGGPHGAWEREGSYAALDFAPSSTESGCVKSNAWVVAASSGLVVRSGNGVVVLDLDGDGHEQTGWVLVYLHVSSQDRIQVGTWVGEDDHLGHPSCEGGISTGTHVHLARKYNGEWVPAAGPIPFNLGGWIADAGGGAYQGTLTRGDQTVIACSCSSSATFIQRGPDDP